MDRAQLIAQAKAKHQRTQLLEQAKAKHQSSQAPADVVQQMPEFLSWKDRAIAKNFAQSPEKQVEFIKKQYPNAEVRLQDGQVQLRNRGDSQFSVLDPDTGFFSKDFLHDAGDIAYDLVADGVQGVSTALGAVGGAAAGGVGALPGAMAAGGASGAGLEALRQKLGQSLGIPQEVDGTDVAVTGGVGAISPLLMGAGKPTASFTARLAKSLGAKDATIQAAEAGGRGALERGWDAGKQKVLPKLGEWMSGVDAGTIRSYARNVDQVDALERDGVTNYVDDISKRVQKTLGDKQTQLGKNVQDAINNAGSQVDTTSSKNAFLDRIKFLESRPELTNAEQAEINSLKGVYNKYFGLAKSVEPDQAQVMNDDALKQLYGALDVKVADPLAAKSSISEPIRDSVLSQKPNSQPNNVASWQNVLNQTEPNPTSQTGGQFADRFFKEANQEITGQADILADEATALANAYRKQNQGEIQRILRAIDTRRAEIIKNNTRTEIASNVDAGRAFDLQKKLKQAAAFETNMTPETVSAKGSARQAYHSLNDELDQATSGLSKQAKDQYSRWKRIEGEIENNFADGDKTFKTLTSLDTKGKTLLKERLDNLADAGELDLTKEADVLGAYKSFANPSLMPVSAKGSTSTSRSLGLAGLGAAGGGYLGNEVGGTQGAALGGAGGAAAAGFLGSPAMMKRMIKANIKAEDIARKLSPPGGAGMYLNPATTDLVAPWLMMNQE